MTANELWDDHQRHMAEFEYDARLDASAREAYLQMSQCEMWMALARAAMADRAARTRWQRFCDWWR